MKTHYACLLTLISMLGLTVLSGHSMAAVFVCRDDNCNAWDKITETQFNMAPSDGQTTTIRQALDGASEDSVKNGFNSVSNTNLYLKKSLWHKGGIESFHGLEHITTYIYKSTDLNTRIKTCHIFSYKTPKGSYHATCLSAEKLPDSR